MFWWRHTGGTPPESSPSDCPSTGESGLSPASPALSTDEGAAQSIAWEDQASGNVRRSADAAPEAPLGRPSSATACERPRSSAHRRRTSSPRRGRSRFRTGSSILHPPDLRKLCHEGIDVNRSGSGPHAVGGECLSPQSEEYLSACSEAFNSVAASEDKDMSFMTGTASPQSDSDSAVRLHHGSLSSSSCMSSTSPRVAEDSNPRLHSAPEGLVGASVTAASLAVRSLSLPLLGPPMSTTASRVLAGRPLTPFRWVCRSPSNNGKGGDGQKPLHVQMKAFATKTSLNTRRSASNGRLTPCSLQAASRSSSREVSQEHAPGINKGSFSDYGPCLAREARGAGKRWGSKSFKELGTSPQELCSLSPVAKLTIPHGDPELLSVGLSPNNRDREDNDTSELKEPHGGACTKSKSFQYGTPAADVFGPVDHERRGQSWTPHNTKSSSAQLLPTSNSADYLPFLLLSSPHPTEPLHPPGEAERHRAGKQCGESKVPTQENCREALHLSRRRDTGAVNPGILGEQPNLRTPRRMYSIGNSFSVSNGDGICASSGIDRNLQQSYKEHGASPVIVQGPDASPCSNVSFARESAKADENFQDAPDVVGGEVEAPQREVSHGSEGRTSCGDEQQSRTRQRVASARVQGASALSWSNLGFARDAAEAEGSFQEASSVVGGEIEELQLEVSCGKEGRRSCGDTQQNHTRQSAVPANVQEPRASSCSSLAFVEESAEADGNLQGLPDEGGEGANELQSELSSETEGPGWRGDTQQNHTSQRTVPFSVQGAALSLSSSVDSARNAAEADESFQDASDVGEEGAGGQQREMPRGGNGEASCWDEQQSRARQGTSPASVCGPGASPSNSVDFSRESAEECQNVQNAPDVVGGEAAVPQHEVSRDSEGMRLSGDAQELHTRQGTLVLSVDGASSPSCLTLSLARGAAKPEKSLYDETPGPNGEAGQPASGTSHGSDATSWCHDLHQTQANQAALPATRKDAATFQGCVERGWRWSRRAAA
ncbi:hypothetical protein, conserved [Eimeria praecox]|uniref:Uncharacterized protein n=1 Tax=Eimeria praecox TaxID=51316 RepID=U6GGF1_9EIME|nr:hypothetical protein, conserved [Eimeria praecox]